MSRSGPLWPTASPTRRFRLSPQSHSHPCSVTNSAPYCVRSLRLVLSKHDVHDFSTCGSRSTCGSFFKTPKSKRVLSQSSVIELNLMLSQSSVIQLKLGLKSQRVPITQKKPPFQLVRRRYLRSGPCSFLTRDMARDITSWK